MERHIAFCVNNEYANYIRPVIKSIIRFHENDRDKYVINILSDNVSIKNRHVLKEMVNNLNNINIVFHIIDDQKLKNLKKGNWTIHTWYRILLPEILPNDIDRVLYLDADTLVLTNLSHLFKINMKHKSIAASIDYQNLFDYAFERCGYEKSKGYVCAGVMMINLDYWRANKITDRIIKWAKANEGKIKNPDQDAINYICRDSKIILPMRYGFMNCFVTNPVFRQNGYDEQIDECIETPVIIHYCSTPPWYKEYRKHLLHDEWEKYNRMLDKPVKRHYQAKNLLKIKIILWRLLHFKKL